MSHWLVRADTGGTFTDGWAQNPEGEVRRCKVLSDGSIQLRVSENVGKDTVRVKGAADYPDGFFAGWQVGAMTIRVHQGECLTVAEEWPLQVGDILSLRTGEEAPLVAARILTTTFREKSFPEMDFRVATTRGTNALLEGKGTEPVLFVTKGFGDLPSIRDQRRPDLFARSIQKNKPITNKIVEISARHSVEGKIIAPFDYEALRQSAREYLRVGERVAVVALLHADRFPALEHEVEEVLLEEGFEDVTLSSGLSSQLGYLPRMETALANGYLGPVMNSFKERISQACAPSLLTSAGGLQTVIEYEPVDSLLSGPAGGLVGAMEVARAAGFERILTFDMGGTSTDVARLEGVIPLRYEQTIGPVRVRRPGVRMETVAAGGGSICRWHQGGLQVGPESAGADPGPACYGRGGPFTLTDVNLLLGYLDEARVQIPVSRQAAQLRFDELKQVMTSEGAQVPDARSLLFGLRAIAVERMAEAVRAISLGEGFEPSDYTLVAFGGAGPQHACELAESLGVQRVLVPGDAGLLSAWGLHRSRREGVVEEQVLATMAEVADDWVTNLMALAEEAVASVPGGELARWLIEMRVQGQSSSLEIESEGQEIPMLRDLLVSFQQRYQDLFGYPCSQEHAVEVVMVRAIASEEIEEREKESFSQPVAVEGLLKSDFCTILANPGWQSQTGSRGSLLLETTNQQKEQAWDGVVGEELMRARFESLAEGMGELLRRTALSTNVKERLDFSCALLDGAGRLLINAPHIPVHLGALGVCVRRISEGRQWRKGDVVVVNHPGYGGSHLPDVTVISPVFGAQGVIAFVANRAHHSEIGGKAPGSMPGDAISLEEEGVVISPRLLVDAGQEYFKEVEMLLRQARYPSRAVAENLADLRAQVAANRSGVLAMEQLVTLFGEEKVLSGMESLFQRAESLMAFRLQEKGEWSANDALDDGTPVRVKLRSSRGWLEIDFGGSAAAHPGNLNATEGVTRSAVLYALRLWLDEDLPLNEGLLSRVQIHAQGTFLQPEFPSNAADCPAVVGGNVETSQRVVELILRALEISAESQGTMNNFLFGNERFGYYETIGGGSGATDCSDGASGVHVHMTNTAITDPEVLEYRFPVRLHQFALRQGSGGAGQFTGGDGLIREVEFLEKMTVTLLTQRRERPPRGSSGGGVGAVGEQSLWRDGHWISLPGMQTFDVSVREKILLKTPGGGGYGDLTPISVH